MTNQRNMLLKWSGAALGALLLAGWSAALLAAVEGSAATSPADPGPEPGVSLKIAAPDSAASHSTSPPAEAKDGPPSDEKAAAPLEVRFGAVDKPADAAEDEGNASKGESASRISLTVVPPGEPVAPAKAPPAASPELKKASPPEAASTPTRVVKDSAELLRNIKPVAIPRIALTVLPSAARIQASKPSSGASSDPATLRVLSTETVPKWAAPTPQLNLVERLKQVRASSPTQPVATAPQPTKPAPVAVPAPSEKSVAATTPPGPVPTPAARKAPAPSNAAKPTPAVAPQPTLVRRQPGPPARAQVARLPVPPMHPSAGAQPVVPAHASVPSREAVPRLRIDPSMALPPHLMPPPATTAPPVAARPVPFMPPGAHTPSAMLVARRAAERVNQAFVLAERGAVYSARAEFRQALTLVANAFDAEEGTRKHTKALTAGLRALEEADDFALQYSDPDSPTDIAPLISAHETEVLKDVDHKGLTPLLALQRYYAYATEQLIEAGGHHPTASIAYYGLARLQSVMTNRRGSRSTTGPKAIALHQAAVGVDPNNYLAANELGVLLACYGELAEAHRWLSHSLSIREVPETWHNLAKVDERLGQQQAAQHARQRHLAMVDAQRQHGLQMNAFADKTGGKPIQWMSPEQFAMLSGPGDPIEQTINDPAKEPAPRPSTEGDAESGEPAGGIPKMFENFGSLLRFGELKSPSPKTTVMQ